MTSDIAGGFEFDGFRARAESVHDGDLEWLEEFLCPQFTRVSADGAGLVVRFSRDPERFAKVVRDRDAVSERVTDCFALDQQVIRLPSWRDPGGSACILDEKFHSVYLVHSATDIEIVASTRRRGPRIPAMRVLREYAMNHSLTSGHLFIHGSCVAVDDAGILIAGPSGAGKTTLLMHLLSLGNAEFISNDRVLAQHEQGATRLVGMPAIVTLRSTTLDMYPAIQEQLAHSPFNHYKTIRESELDAKPIRSWTDARYGLTPAQFCQLMGVRARGSALANVVLMPRQTHEPGHITLTRLPPDVVAQKLRDAIFGIGCWSHESNVFALPSDREVIPAGELERRCRRFAASLPVFDCALGQQAYADPAATRAVLAELSD